VFIWTVQYDAKYVVRGFRADTYRGGEAVESKSGEFLTLHNRTVRYSTVQYGTGAARYGTGTVWYSTVAVLYCVCTVLIIP
jgi:hypothetical protein